MVVFTRELHNKYTLVSTIIILLWSWFVGLDYLLRYIMLSFFISDFLMFYSITTNDIVLHHILSILMIVFYWSDKDKIILILTEISTPFLILFRLHKGGNINKILFILTFFYFRIYNLGTLLMKRRYEIENPVMWLFFFLFLLNCWWAEIIIRKTTPQSIKYFLRQITPYTHLLTTLAISTHNKSYVNIFLLISPFASFAWHKYQTIFFYILDLFCLHSLSFCIALQHSQSALLSLPFHIGDILFYYFHHKTWLISSIGYDVSLVFYYKKDFMWLFGWLLITLLLIKQTFGHGSTQSIIHLVLSFIFYRYFS